MTRISSTGWKDLCMHPNHGAGKGLFQGGGGWNWGERKDGGLYCIQSSLLGLVQALFGTKEDIVLELVNSGFPKKCLSAPDFKSRALVYGASLFVHTGHALLATDSLSTNLTHH